MNIIKKFTTRVSRYGFLYVVKVIIKNKIYRPLNQCVMKISKLLWKNSPIKNTIVIESHNDFDTNGGAFYDYLIEHTFNDKYKIIWLIKNKAPRDLPKNVKCYNISKPSFRKSYHICTAKIITCDDVVTEKVQKQQIMIYLSHGAVSLKRPNGFMNLPDCLDYCLTSSDFMAPIHADIFNLTSKKEKQIILGYPVHDILYQPSSKEIRKVTKIEYSKVILWMPTFRRSKDFNRNDSETELALGIPVLSNIKEYKELNEFLKEKNTLLIIKIHPMQDMTTVKIKNESNIKVLNGELVKQLGIDNYKLMKDTDALISDYSSAAYDYLHLNRPIAYTVDDMTSYKMAFIVDNPDTMMAGPSLKNIEQLRLFIEDVISEKDTYNNKRTEVLKKVFKYHDGNSSKRLVDFLEL